MKIGQNIHTPLGGCMNRRPQTLTIRGFTLVELMIAMVLGLIVIGGVIAMFIGTQQTSRTQEASSRVQETGRLAVELIARDARQAGFHGCRGGDVNNLLDTSDPAYDESLHGVTQAFLEPTAPALLAPTATTSRHFFTVHRMASHGQFQANGNGGGQTPPILIDDGPVPVDQAEIAMVADPRGNCEIFKRTNASSAANLNRAGGSVGSPPHNVGAGAGADYTEFTGPVDIMSIRSTTYFIGDSTTTPGVASLYRHHEQAGTSEEIVQGVYDMRIEYGRDTSGNRQVDGFTSADNVGSWTNADWSEVAAIRVHLLVYNGQEGNVVDDPQQNILFGGTLVNAPDRRLYRTFTTTVAARNLLD